MEMKKEKALYFKYSSVDLMILYMYAVRGGPLG